MTMTMSVYTIGAGDLLEEVFNAVAAIFNDKTTILELTHLAIILGGFAAIFLFSKTRDIKELMKWGGQYVLVTSLMLYPIATVAIVDRTDSKPRSISHVPLSLAIFASITSRFGIGMAELVETVFHLPEDESYNKTGMLMGSKLVMAASDFQITDPDFLETLNEFMQQCVFYDLLLNRYTVNDLIQAKDPWKFIKDNASQARAFPLNGEITLCKAGTEKLDTLWKTEIANAAAIYGAQVLGRKEDVAKTLLSHLKDGYGYLTTVSEEGSSIMQTNLLANAMSQALSHLSANTNAPAALAAFEDTKTELQIRHTLDVTGRQAGFWLQEFKNIMEEVLYGSFIFVYFLSYFPFGMSVIRNYLFGMFYLQSLSPMFAIVNFAATFYAKNKATLFTSSHGALSGLSIGDLGGITQANADAMALAGYLTFAVTIGGGIMLFRGLPGALQSAGQYLGGVIQNAASHVTAEAIGGNLSVGNTHFANHSQFNTNANHFDTNARHASGMLTLQTAMGSTVSVTSGGTEVMDNRGALSNLGVSVNVTDSVRTAASAQAQNSYTAAYSQMRGASEHYSTGFRQIDDFGKQQSHFENSGLSSSRTESSGLSRSSHEVSQLVESFAKEHHVSHEKAAQVLAQACIGYKEIASVGASGSIRSSSGSLYNEAVRFSKDQHLSQAVDAARRDAKEAHYRLNDDAGSRASQSIARSFDEGDSLRADATSNFSKAESFSTLASKTEENAASINANYTQEFYTWMRHQPLPHGNGTFSRSAVDHMAVEELAKLQSHANQFVEIKTAETIHSFEQKNHLNDGRGSIEQAYQNNNGLIHDKAHIKQADHAYQDRVNQAEGNLSQVDSAIQTQIQSEMHHDKVILDEKSSAIQEKGDSIENHAREKVKEGVLGSLTKKVEKLL